MKDTGILSIVNGICEVVKIIVDTTDKKSYYYFKNNVYYNEGDVDMLVTKTVKIEFANSEWRAVDCIQDLRKAAKSASLNLFSKYDVRIELPRIVNDTQVVMDMRIPEEIAETFSIGNHLRGISAYLIKYCNGRYNNAVVGNRLLNYIVIPVPEAGDDQLSVVQRLSLISEMAELLKNSDTITNDKISRIIAILHE